MEILRTENMSFTYPTCSSPTVKGISLSVKSGEFIVLCGATGSGKSTFLRCLKREITPNGTLSGKIFFEDRELSQLSARESAAAVGFVMQSPEQQIVTDKVWHELAFGLESLGLSKDEISRRIAETASALGIGELFERDTAELSGGQKQLLSLTSVLVMQPRLLILDEPTAQLDPIAATDLITAVKRLCSDFGMTVIMTEHRLEEAAAVCDRLLVMEDGEIIINDTPEKAVLSLKSRPELLLAMPAAARIFTSLGGDGRCPLTVRDGRRFIADNFSAAKKSLKTADYVHSGNAAVELKNVCLRYEKNLPDVLHSLDLTVYEGELFCILGGNGSGKTSLLKVLSGLVKPYCGNVKILGKPLKSYKNQSLYRECLTMLPQDVQTVFLENSVRDELLECGADVSALPFDLAPLMEMHPYDLSGGEQQLVALAKALASKPRLLLLDEPTKGLDAAAKKQIADVLRRLTQSGTTVIVVTHDVEFAAQYSDRCALFFDEQALSPNTPRIFFSSNAYYTTAVCRMTRGIFENAVTVDDAVELCRTGIKGGKSGDCN